MDAPLFAGLRIDSDTLRGTRDGTPALVKLLGKHGISASFFFSVGPDNMGRHLWRLLNPRFLIKMLRSGAPGLYGWDILLRGTFGPGPDIGRHAGEAIRSASLAGHEVGFHAWDHYRWQSRSDTMTASEIHDDLAKGIAELAEITGAPVSCSAAAGWKCTETTLQQKELFAMRYSSDCRGDSIFRPVVDGVALTPQIPVTLPTYDEMIGRDAVTDDNYNATLLNRFRPGRLNVLTIHTEVEGLSRLPLFDDFLSQARARNIHFVPLGDLLPVANDIPPGHVAQERTPGRAGTVCVQMATGPA